ncbi:hypothetical protein ACMBCN_01605, partial [Candidatus Liberibacter asiaticus]
NRLEEKYIFHVRNNTSRFQKKKKIGDLPRTPSRWRGAPLQPPVNSPRSWIREKLGLNLQYLQ